MTRFLGFLLAVVVVSLCGGFLFFISATVGSLAIGVWNEDSSVRFFTYIGMGAGALLGVAACVTYVRGKG